VIVLSQMIDEQRRILSKVRFFEAGARYSQLQIKEIENDLFNYHLQKLVKDGYLAKGSEVYRLTELGKSVVTNIDEEDNKAEENYKVSVYMCLVMERKVLLYRRKKHPQYGYVGLPSGKMKYGERIVDAAARELLEETGLRAEFKIVGNLRQIRKNSSGKVIEDGVFYVCFADGYRGQFGREGKEGEFFWAGLDEVAGMEKLFRPSVEVIVEEIKKGLKQQFIYEFEPEPEEY